MSGYKCIACNKRDIAFNCEYYCLGFVIKNYAKEEHVLDVKE
jgi:hypothetical protein